MVLLYTVNDLIDAWDVHLILGTQAGAFDKQDAFKRKRRLLERSRLLGCVEVFPLIVVYCLFRLLKTILFQASFIHKNCSEQFLSSYFLFWAILNLNLPFAVNVTLNLFVLITVANSTKITNIPPHYINSRLSSPSALIRLDPVVLNPQLLMSEYLLWFWFDVEQDAMRILSCQSKKKLNKFNCFSRFC